VVHFVAALLLLLLLQVRGVHDRVQEILNTEYEASRSYRPTTKDWLASHWQGFMSPAQMSRIRNTGALNLHVCPGVAGASTSAVLTD
jgi:hypothetical protein